PKFILTDLRSERDPAEQKDDAIKSMMGARQKEWFKQQLLEANGKYPLIFWVSSVPWIGTAGTNYYRVSTNTFGYIHHTNITAAMRPPQRERRNPEGADQTQSDGTEATEGESADRPARRRAGRGDLAGFGDRGGGTTR